MFYLKLRSYISIRDCGCELCMKLAVCAIVCDKNQQNTNLNN